MTAAAGGLALVALAVATVALGALHLAGTGLSPIRDPVSAYGISAARAGYRVLTIALGISGAALALGLDRTRQVDVSGGVIALLLVFAGARAAISWFPMDRPGGARTETGRRHGLLAFAAFGGIATAAISLGGALGRGSTWHAIGSVSSALGWAMVVTLLLLVASRTHGGLRARFGAIERAFYACAIGWIAVFAVACITQLH